jgi:hypothetical protein
VYGLPDAATDRPMLAAQPEAVACLDGHLGLVR